MSDFERGKLLGEIFNENRLTIFDLVRYSFFALAVLYLLVFLLPGKIVPFFQLWDANYFWAAAGALLLLPTAVFTNYFLLILKKQHIEKIERENLIRVFGFESLPWEDFEDWSVTKLTYSGEFFNGLSRICKVSFWETNFIILLLAPAALISGYFLFF